MQDTEYKAVAIVGLGAVLPDAPDAKTFWQNIKNGRYSISEVAPDRWDPALYYDEDRKAPAKTYSKIGGWTRDWVFDPLKWKLPIPPRVSDSMDRTQKWAIMGSREALMDYGYPNRPLDPDRTAVIMGTAMGGDNQLMTALRILFPEYAEELRKSPSFMGLPAEVQQAVRCELQEGIARRLPEVTEDTMPGELANIVAGRIAAVFNFHGPNYITDAACASAMAAITAAAEGLVERQYDTVLTGGVDANMSASTFTKFCKIGALSATGTRPYADGADGFVMGEGAAIFLLKRLEDAERDGDHVYAVLRGIGGSSDGKGKGITAPNPAGQQFAVRRAWANVGASPASATMVEGHGTSTRVGDMVELQCLHGVFGQYDIPVGRIALGSVKSNIGHLKGAAGAAGLLKAALSLDAKLLPPSLGFAAPNSSIDFTKSPFRVNTELRPWDDTGIDGVRRVGVSAFGFGGTNFHAVLEEHIPGRLDTRRKSVPSAGVVGRSEAGVSAKAPLRGALVIGGSSEAEVAQRLEVALREAEGGHAHAPAPPFEEDLRASVRVAIDYADDKDLAAKAGRALKALKANSPGMWQALRAQGIFYGKGPGPKVAFLYTGQGSQYVNMMEGLRESEPIVAGVFADADRVMTPLLGKPLSDYIFIDAGDEAQVRKAEEDLRQTAITQPAVLATDASMTAMLGAYGITPDMVMGHSLGEYGALVAAGALPFADALEAVSARGREMTNVSMEDNGAMAAVFGPMEDIERSLESIDGYVVVANINSHRQAVIGGATQAVKQAVELFQDKGYQAMPLNVSHAFHTSIVAPASEPLKDVLRRLRLQSPQLPLVANLSGEFYPMGPGVESEMVDILGKQVASPVQFIKGLNTLYDAGARVFVEVGPKKALHGFVEDVLGDKEDVVSLFTNHPKLGDVPSFNAALCGLYAAGLGVGVPREDRLQRPLPAPAPRHVAQAAASRPQISPAVPAPQVARSAPAPAMPLARSGEQLSADGYVQLGKLFADFLQQGMKVYSGGGLPQGQTRVTISGAGLGLPGSSRMFDETNVERILRGEQMIDAIPMRQRKQMVEKNIVRLVKSDGGARFERIDRADDVLKLAGRGGLFDLAKEFGFPEERLPALDIVTRMAIASGLDALRDAGIPLVQRYKTTTTGSKLPERWGLPNHLRDDTGVIFASAFPGYDALAADMGHFYADHARRGRLADLQSLRSRVVQGGGSDAMLLSEIDRRIRQLEMEIERDPYTFDRRFVFKVLAMGHSQLAEYIGARGPNTHVNAACASTTHAVSVAEDWIRTGRCRRVVVVSADAVTSDNLLEWFGPGFLASGAAATDELVEDAAIPFDRRRHGLVLGMGAASLVVESAESVQERGIRPICQVLSTVTSNSAYHGTRLDIEHIEGLMERLVAQAEQRWGVNRAEMAAQTVFVSHETYTPARGGSAQAEVQALRSTFGHAASQIVVANTKGITGHAMGAGIEDVVAVKALETGVVPPVVNFREPDPELGQLNLSKGGAYPVTYSLRLGAGFGSQVALTLMRWEPTPDGRRPLPHELGYLSRVVDAGRHQSWLASVSGYARAELEVVQRTLRVKDQGPPKQLPAPQPIAGAPARSPAPVATQPPPAPTVAPASIAGAPAPAAAPAVPAVDPVQVKVLEIVSESTGYPSDMLDLELDLEADLGIDTVKQAETFAAVREAYDIAREENLQLREFSTLKHVIKFVHDRRPDLAAQAAAAAPAPAAAAAPAGSNPVQNKVLEIVSQSTGYPSDMLDLELDLEADLGIDTVKQAETFAAVREAYDIAREENLQLRDFPTLKHVIQFVLDRRPDLAAQIAAAPAVPVAPAAVPAPASYGAPAVAPVTDAVQSKVLEIVSDKTGYPSDMLDPELDLEADLGIDTVKQAETFAAVREAYDIPREENLQLRDFPTLNHVIGWVREKRPDLGAPTVATPAVSAAPVAAAAVDDPVQAKVMEIVAEKTGYPSDMLEPELDLEADLGIDTVKQAETFAAVREAYDIPREENLQLRDFPTLNHVVGWVREKRPDLAPAASASAVAAPKAAAAAVDDPVQAKVMEIVAEKTGYPSDMLELELDLEADLGIDTVKQAETFAAVREAYDIPREENLQLRDFPTLNHVIGWVREKRPDLAAGAQSAAATTTAETQPAGASPTAAAAAAQISGDMEAANRVPRRTPVPVVRPPLGQCKETGVSLGSNSRVIVMPDANGVATALVKRLKKLGVKSLLIDDAPDAESLEARIQGWLKEGPIQGVYWLSALDDEGPIDKMSLGTFREAIRVRVKLLYTAMRVLYDHVGKAGTFLVSATRLGGQHGYDEEGAVAPLGGAVCGFTKTFKREKGDALVKSVDFGVGPKATVLADALIAETRRDPGVVEVGYKDATRWTLGLSEQPAPEPQEAFAIGKDTVFVITGAAGSIVSAITADLAAAAGGTFYLLDLTPEPDPKDEDLQAFASDKEGLKRDIFERIKAKGERATPVMVERELARLERLHSALSAIQSVEAAGGKAHYRSLNLMDAEAVAGVVSEIRQEYGRIDVLVHAAGLEISHLLPSKPAKEFDLVFDVKAEGWFNLLRAIGDMPLGATVAFSSIAGRFGNAGQADYSAANDLLCKTSSSFKTSRPRTRGITIDWTAWGGIGMAVRGSIPKMMELAGIDMLAPEAGIPVVRRELVGGTNSELVVAERLGILVDEWDSTGGLDPRAVNSVTPGPMSSTVVGMGLHTGFTVETTLDPTKQPFLFDHQIDGTAVLPGVMGIEAFGELAKRLFPEWSVAAIEDVRFLAPFKFYRDQPRKVTVSGTFRKEGEQIVAECRLAGSRRLPNQSEPQVKTHFAARVRLTQQPLKANEVEAPVPPEGVGVGNDDIYQVYFHGPAYQVLERVWRREQTVLGLMPADLPENHRPPEAPTVMSPRLIELCFQTAGVFEIGVMGRMGLPQHVTRVAAYRDAERAAGRVYAVVTPRLDDHAQPGSFDAQVVDEKGNLYLELSGYRTVEMPGGVQDAQRAPLQAAMG